MLATRAYRQSYRLLPHWAPVRIAHLRGRLQEMRQFFVNGSSQANISHDN